MFRPFCVVTVCWLTLVGCSKPDINKVGGTRLVYQLRSDSQDVDAKACEEAMLRRLDPSGSGGIEVKIADGKVEIAVPNSKRNDLDVIKRFAVVVGELRFQILADQADASLVSAMTSLADTQSNEVLVDGDVAGRWFVVATAHDDGSLMLQASPTNIVRERDGETELLLRVSKLDITGKDMRTVSKGYDDAMRPAINFTLTEDGAKRMRKLTSQNQGRRLAIVFDEQIMSAPTIQSEIQERGQITGSFSEEEVAEIIALLRVGEMPFRLSDVPPEVITVAAE